MVVSTLKFRNGLKAALSPIQFITKSDTVACEINGYYPRGFRVLTGGTLTVWTLPSDMTSSTINAVKKNLGTVEAGFEWTYGSFCGIAATAEDNSTPVSSTNILAIP